MSIVLLILLWYAIGLFFSGFGLAGQRVFGLMGWGARLFGWIMAACGPCNFPAIFFWRPGDGWTLGWKGKAQAAGGR